MLEKNEISEVFASNVFSEAVMAEKLPRKVYENLRKTIEDGEELDLEIANVVAHAMKEWALEKGATHYTHWFQPMTGITAEKHDSFISSGTSHGHAILEFSGKELIKGEPDASSFPSGGLRATFEARGYTAWDCTSPAFLKEDAAGVTLCIPTAFYSYTGEALDKKTPLLRSMQAINKQALRLLKLFGHNDVKRVECSVGPEQEYFLIDREKFLQREDLRYTGRTLFGTMPPKGQELDDHYFGSLKERIAGFMKELNLELWKLGVLSKTQHNEVAPAQHELAPIYGTANIATDHNQLIMETMKKVAKRRGLECLLHEKPFAGVNGSGKHVNWSLITNTGKNLLDAGKTPHENVQFLLFLSAIIRAVDENATLLRLSASNAGNDHRLGAHEAPPAIISIFLGDQLEDVINQLIETGQATSSKQGGNLKIGVSTLPVLRKDATDRNRTSPFAFTGNKFEFRMVASSMSIADANTVINTIVADILCDMADELEKAPDFNVAIHNLIKRTLTEHRRIIFNGNGYSDEWVEEARRRGLPNVRSIVDAISSLEDIHTVGVFEKHHVLSKSELHSRKEIYYEAYSKTINIEAKTMIEMVNKRYIPAIIKSVSLLADSINNVRKATNEADVSVQLELLSQSTYLLSRVKKVVKKLEIEVSEAAKKEEGIEQANYFKEIVFQTMSELRTPVDELERIIDKNIWPVPSYGDLLFEL
ncbi:MAG TPA: glutamine synthetase III [Lachnospiraceae bacterium]|nr:glutamine synthetase III [Lachnospiraceae bacterium]HEX3075572.1 glutamine synthetase III [Lachnospiraceae bacterium]